MERQTVRAVNEDEAQQIYLAYQPIIDRRLRGIGFELLFRAGYHYAAKIITDVSASASVIVHAFSHFGIQQVLGEKLGFINVSKELLMSDSIELLPRGKVVLELLETMEIDLAVIQRCQELVRSGFTLALDDFMFDECYRPLLDIVSIVKVDVLQLNRQELQATVEKLKRWPKLKLLAEKVETVEDFEYCRKLGFNWFQGYFFARPTILSGKRIDPERTALLKIIKQLNANEELEALEATFHQHPGLVLKLLRLVNSVALSRYPIESIRDALRILGTRKLQQWVQLLLYAGDADTRPGPLMRMAARRGKMMELLAQHLKPGGMDASAGFMTGILSLVDVLLGMDIANILEQINVSQEIRMALVDRLGVYGQMLRLVELAEQEQFEESVRLARNAGVSSEQLMDAQLMAVGWADRLAIA